MFFLVEVNKNSKKDRKVIKGTENNKEDRETIKGTEKPRNAK